ncbi:UDP-2,4-diacetamido-2,4,6-trideoxy-beta-L-altropyranose hydrolase [Tenuibacillus multivorans]|uniref:UDP-2,4-diacetamido-2,4,6-trideoxy-beta-L-altropyranose hydrolase n=1 Tax=Tenuibacillus multivorans TaxID=237069 RepID=A0A1G9YNE0_9BACI|nr:UDP-2,4-diacetamido-2,4,6-trideoxy-beta-L-altropyranose hydrolase [Tenuibacillus multivorans]
MVNIYIRTDASIEIGTGHVMRCLTLAHALKLKGAKVSFISKDLEGHLIDFIRQNGFDVAPIRYLPTFDDKIDAVLTQQILKNVKVDWLIIDHYEIDERWERQIRPYTEKIMVIEDFSRTKHDCDLLLNYHVYATIHDQYKQLLPNHTRTLLGSDYILLRDEFLQERKDTIVRDGSINRILVSFGGTDPTGETVKTLQALQQLNLQYISVDVVIGDQASDKGLIQQLCEANPQWRLHIQSDNIAKLMRQADLAVGSGGVSSYERCFLGLPTLTIQTADNQHNLLQSLKTLGVIDYLGKHDNVDQTRIQQKLNGLIQYPSRLKEMSNRCLSLFNSEDGVELVSSTILEG